MIDRSTSTIALAAAIALAACSQTAAQQTSAERETILSATAVVESVDQTTRHVALRTQDGRLVELVAGPEVRNLPQLEAGDTVRFDYYESVAVEMAEPADPAEPLGVVVTQRAAEGDKPGGAVASATSFVVELVSYDPASAVAILKMHDGTTRAIPVQPEMQAFAQARKPGDRMLVTITEAIAISIEETAG